MGKKDFRKLYEDLVKSDWFKKAYHDKSLGECPFEIPELAESEDERIRKELSNLPYTDNELNEAAEEFAEAEWDGLHDNDGNPLYTEDYIQYTFKAGVEWAKKHQ